MKVNNEVISIPIEDEHRILIRFEQVYVTVPITTRRKNPTHPSTLIQSNLVLLGQILP